MKKEKDLKPGIKYRGYGYINTYGEFIFEPEDTGARIGQIKQVTSGDGYSVSTSKKWVLCHIKIERNIGMVSRIKNFLNITNKLITIFKEYDF